VVDVQKLELNAVTLALPAEGGLAFECVTVRTSPGPISSLLFEEPPPSTKIELNSASANTVTERLAITYLLLRC
jgi:hypothetical protein